MYGASPALPMATAQRPTQGLALRREAHSPWRCGRERRIPPSSPLTKTKTHRHKATSTHPNFVSTHTRGYRHGHHARTRVLARLLSRRLWRGLLWRGAARRSATCEQTTSGGGGEGGGPGGHARAMFRASNARQEPPPHSPSVRDLSWRRVSSRCPSCLIHHHRSAGGFRVSSIARRGTAATAAVARAAVVLVLAGGARRAIVDGELAQPDACGGRYSRSGEGSHSLCDTPSLSPRARAARG